jgi:hypothetical protein
MIYKHALGLFRGDARNPAGVLALALPAGEYTIEYRFRPTKTWQILESISSGILVMWLLLWIIAVFGLRDRNETVSGRAKAA